MQRISATGKSCKGFTFLEVMAVLVIVAITSTVIVAGVSERLVSSDSPAKIASYLQKARVIAMSEGITLGVNISPAQLSLSRYESNEWQNYAEVAPMPLDAPLPDTLTVSGRPLSTLKSRSSDRILTAMPDGRMEPFQWRFEYADGTSAVITGDYLGRIYVR